LAVNANAASSRREHDYPGYTLERFDSDSVALKMCALFILEFGIIFDSIFIGLTLAVSGEEFVVLYIVLVFHQTFEGIRFGSRLAIALWPSDMVVAYIKQQGCKIGYWWSDYLSHGV
jgi:hypothetical protein